MIYNQLQLFNSHLTIIDNHLQSSTIIDNHLKWFDNDLQ